MLNRQQVEKVLVLNGVKPTAADEEIRSLLIQARWHEDDVKAALLVLKENVETHETHVDTLHKVFRTDERLQPDTINALLGIDVDLSDTDIEVNRERARGHMTFSQLSQIALVSVALAAISLSLFMWLMKVGPFHQTVI